MRETRHSDLSGEYCISRGDLFPVTVLFYCLIQEIVLQISGMNAKEAVFNVEDPASNKMIFNT
jgi:hypothetical protein